MTASLADRLPALRQRFLAGLERRLDEMMLALHGTADEQALMPMFHSVAGIAGTYGYPLITEISRHCEHLCAGAIEDGRCLTASQTESLRGAVAAMRVAAR